MGSVSLIDGHIDEENFKKATKDFGRMASCSDVVSNSFDNITKSEPIMTDEEIIK